MALDLVEDFAAEWNIVENKGIIKLKLKSKSEFHPIPFQRSEELAAVYLLLMGSKPVFLDAEAGRLTMSIEKSENLV